MYHTLHSSPTLEARTSTGLRKFWRGHILRDDAGNHYTQSEHWQELKSGGTSVVQRSEPYLAQPTNVGRANETTPLAQAQLEFEAMVRKQQDAKHYRDPAAAPAVARPGAMLAHPFDKYGHKLQYPCYVQPKYDGNRMLYDGTQAWSRGGKDYLPAVIAHLQFDTQGYVLDGELILPGNVPLQQTASAVKRFQPGLSDTLEFVVFDVVLNQPFTERYAVLRRLVDTFPERVRLAPTTRIDSPDAIAAVFDRYVGAGFEGVILRNAAGHYAAGQRSKDLLKHKPFEDAEFEVVGVVPAGGGAAANHGKFVLRTTSGETFEAMYAASDTERQALLALGTAAYAGQWVTVRYQTLTERGVPQFPRVVAFRDREEF